MDDKTQPIQDTPEQTEAEQTEALPRLRLASKVNRKDTPVIIKIAKTAHDEDRAARMTEDDPEPDPLTTEERLRGAMAAYIEAQAAEDAFKMQHALVFEEQKIVQKTRRDALNRVYGELALAYDAEDIHGDEDWLPAGLGFTPRKEVEYDEAEMLRYALAINGALLSVEPKAVLQFAEWKQDVLAGDVSDDQITFLLDLIARVSKVLVLNSNAIEDLAKFTEERAEGVRTSKGVSALAIPATVVTTMLPTVTVPEDDDGGQ